MKKAGKVLLIILAVLIAIIGIFAGVVAILNTQQMKKNNEFIEAIKPVEYEAQLVPTLEDDGYYSFKTDNDFRAMQLTDVHIGGGFLSAEKDKKSLTAVARMISAEKPDLVVVTGDIGFPVPYIAGTLNNKNPAKMFADTMEKLGVYWCLVYGNHDTEAYSYFDRADISELYGNREAYPHCLFQAGPEEVDGYGNYIINVRNTTGEITQSFVMLDSHSYVDGDYLGIQWKYDCVHENQVEWYKNEIAKLTDENYNIVPKSLMFMHIPVIELQQAYYDYRDNGNKNTENVVYLDGAIGEAGDISVYSSKYNYGIFDAAKQMKSTQAMFFGHDHLNDIALEVDGIRLGYGKSIDYLAYSNIDKYGAHRGCSIITTKQDGSYSVKHESYYQDKYGSNDEKETVSFEPYGSLED